MPSDILEVLLTSSQEIDGGATDTMMVLAKTSPVPLNSGVQNVWPTVVQALNRAKLLRPPYRQIAIQKAKEYLYGIVSIGSEGGMYLKELNTQRIAQTSMGKLVGQKAGPMDEYLYGKNYLENNPKGADDKLF